MPKFGAKIDTQRIPVLGLIPEQWPAASPPVAPVEGLMWHDTTNKQVKIWLNGSWMALGAAGAGGPPSGNAGGDLAGTYPNPTLNAPVTVAKGGTGQTSALVAGGILYGSTTIAAAVTGAGTSGQLLQSNGASAPTWVAPPSSAPSGAAGGDLTGSTYPNPVIANGAVTNAKLASNSVDTSKIVDGGIIAADLDTSSVRLNTLGVPSNDYNMSGYQLTNLGPPLSNANAATKQYVDNIASGIDAKPSVRKASTGNVPIASASLTYVMDGGNLAAGNRVLLKDQTAPAENGIYIVQGPPWVRATDMDAWTEVPGAFVFVEEGTAYADTGWLATADQGGTLGTTAIGWVQFSAAGQITAGAGMTKTGNTLDVGAGAGITVNADDIQVANNGITNAMIADGAINLATADVTGTLPQSKGGTGGTDAVTARGLLGAMGRYAADLAAMSAGVELAVSHMLGTNDVVPAFRTTADNVSVELNWRVITNNQIGVTADIAFAASAVRAVVVG